MGIDMKTAGFILALLCAAAPGRADGFSALGKELSKAARKSGMQRVVVLPFSPGDSSSAKDGWVVAEKLTTQVVRSGEVRAVERSLLSNLLEEQRLGRTGMLDQSTLKKLGRVSTAEGVITGSFVTLGREIAIQARLIDVETGIIVAASERRVEKDWFENLEAAQAKPPLWVAAPEFMVEAPAFPEEQTPDLRDSVAEDSCSGAAERVDGLNRAILDIKARYWALKLRGGLKLASLAHNPGSEISDPLLKDEFYDRMKSWYAREDIPKLTPVEVKRFVDIDSKAFGLHQKCRA
jgi:TolB-like protein